MNADLRLDTSFFDNIKTVKLIRQLGSDGVVGLLKIWTYAARHKPDGDFPCCNPEDLEIIAGWSGEPGELASCLVDLRFLDKTDGGFCLHNWQERNPWASGASARSEKARKAALARWRPAPDAPSNAPSMLEHQRAYAPSPSPSPKPKDMCDRTEGFEEFYQLYPLKRNPARAQRAWAKAMKRGNGTREIIMEALPKHIAHKAHLKSTGAFCPEWPHPSTWLNDERWKDEIPEVGSEKGTGGWGKAF